METKEQKPWYADYFFGVGDVIDGEQTIYLKYGGISHNPFSVGTIRTDTKYSEFLMQATQFANERDSLLSVQKQLVENLERVTSHLESWRREDTDGQATAETEACLFCARAAILAAKVSS